MTPPLKNLIFKKEALGKLITGIFIKFSKAIFFFNLIQFCTSLSFNISLSNNTAFKLPTDDRPRPSSAAGTTNGGADDRPLATAEVETLSSRDQAAAALGGRVTWPLARPA